MHVLGRRDSRDARDSRTSVDAPTVPFGRFRAPDDSHGVRVELDVDHPHAALVVGKRGSGKTYTLGVLAEGLGRTSGVTGVVVDPMRAFDTLPDVVPATVVRPAISANALPPHAWCDVLELPQHTRAGALLASAAAHADTLDGMHDALPDDPHARAARNAIDRARRWNVFDPDPTPICDPAELTVLDCASLPRPAMAAVVRAVADRLYETAVSGTLDALPWLLVDEAHAITDTAAWPGLRRLLTRGRQPGISTVLATQRPGVLPPEAVSQADLVVAHRLTATDDIDALETAIPDQHTTTLSDRLPTHPGDALVHDDASETTHRITVRERDARHSGRSRTVT